MDKEKETMNSAVATVIINTAFTVLGILVTTNLAVRWFLGVGLDDSLENVPFMKVIGQCGGVVLGIIIVTWSADILLLLWRGRKRLCVITEEIGVPSLVCIVVILCAILYAGVWLIVLSI